MPICHPGQSTDIDQYNDLTLDVYDFIGTVYNQFPSDPVLKAAYSRKVAVADITTKNHPRSSSESLLRFKRSILYQLL